MNNQTTPLVPRYLSWRPDVDAGIDRIRQLLSPSWQRTGFNEGDFHSVIFQTPDILASFLGEGITLDVQKEKFIGVRKETPARRGRADLVLLFYGARQYDLVECKGPREPIICVKGKITKSLERAIQQVSDYRTNLMKTSEANDQQRNVAPQPRLVVIGYSKCRDNTPDRDNEIIGNALRSSPWAREYEMKTLVVTTWGALAQSARESTGAEGKSRAMDERALARFAIARSIVQAGNLAALKPLAEGQHLREYIGIGGEEGLFDAAAARLSAMISTIDDFAIEIRHLPDRARAANAILQLADLCCYTEDGDLPYGAWEHGATHDLLDLIRQKQSISERLTPKLIEVLLTDNSEDVVSRVSHVMRHLPDDWVKKSDCLNNVMRKWAFPKPEALLLDSTKRPLTIQYIHLAYLLALHSVDEAIDFLHRASLNRSLMSDLAQWNVIHCRRDPTALLESLKSKAASGVPRIARFRFWHEGILRVTDEALRRLAP
jgi:hypothetical protein